IRHSRYAWDIRLISVGALLRLLDVKEELEDPAIVNKIHEMLIPREFTKLDEIAELLFTAAADLRPEVESDPESAEVVDNTLLPEEPTGVASFDARSLQKIEARVGGPLIKQTRSSYGSADD